MERIRKLRILSKIILLSLLASFPVFADEVGISFSITEWETGVLDYGVIAEKSVRVENYANEPVIIDLISTCSCMMVEPETLDLAEGEAASFTIFFDTHDDDGEFEKLLIIQTSSDLMPKGFFVVSGFVDVPESMESQEAASEAAKEIGEDSVVRYYYTPGCKSCNRFLRDAEISIGKRDITEVEFYEELQAELKARGETMREVPVLITEDGIFQGEKSVKAAYKAILAGAEIEINETEQGTGVSISILPVLAAGLLDGVNPCAFTSLIFLLSALTVAGRSRRETLIIGLFFTVTVFVTYYLIGLGLFKIMRIADSFELVSRIIRWVLFAVLVLFASLSFYDFYKIRKGRVSEIILQLPDGVKRRMHSSIRAYSKSTALAGSSIIMGFLISIFELGCTGQIYFPTITYIIQTEQAASGYLYLALYNLAFIIPLAAVFVVVFLGVTSKRITKIFQTNLGVVKILTGLLFIAFALLMITL